MENKRFGGKGGKSGRSAAALSVFLLAIMGAVMMASGAHGGASGPPASSLILLALGGGFLVLSLASQGFLVAGAILFGLGLAPIAQGAVPTEWSGWFWVYYPLWAAGMLFAGGIIKQRRSLKRAAAAVILIAFAFPFARYASPLWLGAVFILLAAMGSIVIFRRSPRGAPSKRAGSALLTLWAVLLPSFCAMAAAPTRDSIEKAIQAEPSAENLLRAGIFYHDLAVGKADGDARKRSQALFGSILKKNPKEAVAMAYLGSLSTVEGRDAYLPWNKLRGVEKGCDMMDKAVDWEPGNITVRMVRFQNNYQLPDFFNREHYIQEDIAFLRSERILGALDSKNRALVLFFSGKLSEKKDLIPEAKTFYRQAVDTGDPEFSAKAGNALKRIGG